MAWRKILGVAVVAACCAGGDALAGGFEFNENDPLILGRAGAFVARADSPMAIHYNPAGLVRLDGHKLYAATNLVFFDWRYTRTGDTFLLDDDRRPQPTTMADLVERGFYSSASVDNEANPFFAPSLAWGYGDPEGRWGAAFGIYGPNAHGQRKFPEKGPQRFMLTEMDVLLAYVTGSFAYSFGDLSLGASLQWVVMPNNTLGLTIDGSVDPAIPQAENTSYLTQAHLDVPGWTGFTAIVGLHWAPTRFLEVGLSSRILPAYLTGEGEATISFVDNSLKSLQESGSLGLTDGGVSFGLVLPPWIRTGLRYIGRDKPTGREVFDLELDFVYEFWSVLEEYEVKFDGDLEFFGTPVALADVNLQKQYDDTWAIKLGSSWNAVADLFTLHLGASYESAAAPVAYTNIDFSGFARVGLSAGLTFTLGPVDLTLGYQAVIQARERVVKPDEGRIYMVRPTSPPSREDPDYPGVTVNAGRYESLYHTIGLGVVVDLGGGAPEIEGE